MKIRTNLINFLLICTNSYYLEPIYEVKNISKITLKCEKLLNNANSKCINMNYLRHTEIETKGNRKNLNEKQMFPNASLLIISIKYIYKL